MEHVSTEAFQIYHDTSTTTIPDLTRRRSFLGISPKAVKPKHERGFQHRDLPIDSIERDPDNHEYDESLSGSARHSSGADEIIFDGESRHSSPQTSHHSDDCMSELPSGSREGSYMPDSKPSSPYTPLKHRSPFRNPSSVRAMQMETTPPPYLTSSNLSMQHTRPIASRSMTPRSTHSQHGSMRTPSKLSPAKKVKKEYPLVLLHLTLLPAELPFSTELMDTVLPGYILENWKLLREQLTDTVLERGILIPHPKEDYDLIEERLLESLELKLPRILKCGHMNIETDEESAGSDEDDDADPDDADVCGDCGRHIRDGRFGSTGAGKRRWDIKIFAANGLMRAGAWAAAWREMERVDVEILPWMDEKMKRELTMRQEEDDRLHDAERRAAEVDEGVEGASGEHARGLDEQRRREIYGDDAQAYVDGLYEEKPAKEPSAPEPSQVGRAPEIPMFVLIQNYVILLARDRRNIAIFLLTILVVFLANRPAMPLTVPSTVDENVHSPMATSATDSLLSVMSLLPSPTAKTTLADIVPEVIHVETGHDGTETENPASEERPEGI